MSGPYLSLQPYLKLPPCLLQVSHTRLLLSHQATTGPQGRGTDCFLFQETFPLCFINFSSFRSQLSQYFDKAFPNPRSPQHLLDLIPKSMHM